MIYCKKKNRECRYPYNINTFQCKKCVEENLSQYPITCQDCRYNCGCIKRGKHQRKMNPCENFAFD